MPRFIALAILAPFAVFSFYVMAQVGYWGIIQSHFHLAGYQVMLDLIIACTLAMIWMWQDAKATGRNAWPFILITVVAGSIGPLLYWALSPANRKRLAAMG
jgi:uncharacterized membrane protein